MEKVEEEFKKMQGKLLDIVEILSTNEVQYKKVRSKVLRIVNDCRRNVEFDNWFTGENKIEKEN